MVYRQAGSVVKSGGSPLREGIARKRVSIDRSTHSIVPALYATDNRFSTFLHEVRSHFDGNNTALSLKQSLVEIGIASSSWNLPNQQIESPTTSNNRSEVFELTNLGILLGFYFQRQP